MKKIYLLVVLSILTFLSWNATAATWYSQGTGDPNVLSSWNSIAGGGGTNPVSFTTAGDIWNMQTNMTTPSGSGWTMSTTSTLNVANVTWTINGLSNFTVGTLNLTGSTYCPGGAGNYFYIYGDFTMSGTAYMTNPPVENFLHFSNTASTYASPQHCTITSTASCNWTYFYIDANTNVALSANMTFNGSSDQFYVGQSGSGSVLNCGPYTMGGSGYTPYFYSGTTLYTGLAGGIDAAIPISHTFNSGMGFGFNGTVAQVTGTGMMASITSPGSLIINNTASGGVTLSQSTSLTATTNALVLTNGKLATGSFNLTVPGNATAVSGAGATAYVNGSLTKSISGFTSVNYEVGDANYSPMLLTLSTAGTGGSIGVRSTAGLHPSATSSGLGISNMINHYWTITNNAATGPATVIPKATYNLADILGGSNTGFATQEFIGSSWLGAALASTNTSSPYTTQPNAGVQLSTLAGDYIFGAQVPYAFATPASLSYGIVPIGGSSVLSTLVAGGNLTGAPITVTSPSANYLVSSTGVAGSFGATASYTYVGSALAATPLYVQFNPTVTGVLSQSVTVTGGGMAAPVSIPVTGNGLPGCSGTPTAGTTVSSPTSGTGGTPFALSLTGTSAVAGLGYQWQSSPDNVTFTPIYGATVSTFSFTGLTGNTYFRCVVSCGASSANSVSQLLTFTGIASACVPSCYYGTTSYYVGTSGNPVIFSGAAGTSISDGSITGSGTGGSPWYYNNIATSITFNPGGVYTGTIGSGYYYTSAQVWIDFNDNGTFESSETVGGYNNYGCCSITRFVSQFYIPATAAPGPHRMRVMAAYNGYTAPGASANYPAYPQLPPCPAAISSSAYYTDTRDYTAVITGTPTTMTSSVSNLNFGNITSAASSVPVQFFTLKGTNLTGGAPINVTPSANYSVSLDGISWTTGTLSVPYSPGYPGGTMNATNVYVQFNSPASAGTYGGTVGVSGGGITPLSIAVTGVSAPACSGTPAGGTASISPSTGGPQTPFTLSVAGTSANGGIFYQWQASLNGGITWTNVAAGLSSTYNFTGISANTSFRCIATCGTGATNTSTITAATMTFPIAASSCVPTSSSSPCSYYVGTSGAPFTVTGANGTSISDASICGSGTGGSSYYYNNTALGVIMNPGITYPAVMGQSGNCYQTGQIWIDFNDNGTFETSETVGGYGYPTNVGSTISSCPTGRANVPMVIPINATVGSHRMRAVNSYTAAYNPNNTISYPVYPALPFCPNTSTVYADTRDYTAIILPASLPLTPCSGVPNPGIMSGTPTNACAAFTATVFNVGETTSPGMSYQWQSSTSPGSGFTNIGGATNAFVVPSVAAVGTVYYRTVSTCANGGGSATSNAIALTYNPIPTITPANPCIGGNATETASPAGGNWVSGTPGNVSIGSATGIATGVIVGSSSTLTYTSPAGCVNNAAVSVNPLPATPIGTLSVCQTQTTTLSDVTGAGSWTSGNTTLATVGSATGIVTGVAAGAAPITFTLASTGCAAAANVTVNTAASISGIPSVCQGFTTTLSASIPGGTWSSSNTAVASVNSGGVVSGVTLGAVTIDYVTPVTGCIASQVVNVTNPPLVYTMTGGGNYCSGGVGVPVGVNGSDPGILYYLFNGGTFLPPAILGTGLPISFGNKTAGGSYGVIANYGSACTATMFGLATVVVNPLPTAYTVSGGGNYCSGGTGVHVFVNNSTIGTNYQLFVTTLSGTIPVGGFVLGTGSPIDFGLQTIVGTYTVQATNTTTGCIGPMAGSATVGTNALPVAQTVTGGGNYCNGGAGLAVGLSGSVAGTSYQLLLGGSPFGGPVAGTGTSISFGSQTSAGTYTVLATITSTGCTNLMSGSATVTIVPLPTVYSVTGGGNYCLGGTGVTIGLNGSSSAVNYQVYKDGSVLGSSTPGTGVALNFGLFTLTGSYTIVATNIAAPFCSGNMFGSVAVATNALPAVFNVTGGGAYCAGAAGAHVFLSGSVAGTAYTLFCNGALIGAASGTGAALDFGFQTTPGSYTVSALITSTGCTATMSGSATVTLNPLPLIQTVSGGGQFCAGATTGFPTINVTPSQSGINYQLYNGALAVGLPVAGTGTALAFAFTSAPAGGSYTVVGTNAGTGCINNMSGSTSIIVNAVPTVYGVTGGGGYCTGSPAGVHIGLSASNLGVNYSLIRSGTTVSILPGSASALDFGSFTTAGTYTVLANNGTTSCTVNMSGNAAVAVNPLPVATYTVTTPGSSAYCFGGAGVVINLTSSDTGVNYLLNKSGITVGSAVTGTGAGITFGAQTAPGAYTVVAKNSTTGCTSNEIGSVNVAINGLPSVFTVTGGGTYCSGGAGRSIGLTASQAGVTYQLYNGLAIVAGASMSGTGSAISFPAQTSAGVYTIVGTNASGCTSLMSGTATVGILSLPTSSYIVTGGGGYCQGGAGMPIGLSSTSIGVSYQLMQGATPVGAPVPGTGVAVTFGNKTTAGGYTVIGTDGTTGCSATMSGTATISINMPPTPANVTGGGNYCPGTTGMPVGLDGSAPGINYQLFVGTTASGAAVAGSGAPIAFGPQTVPGIYTVVATNTTTSCTNTMTGSVTVGAYPLPVVYNVTGGGNVCPGSGVHVGLSGSNSGINYQLYNTGGAVGLAVGGTGYTLDFGNQTAAGPYTVIATSNSTSCTNNMAGSAVIAISPLPASHTVTGGGNYCLGTGGLDVGIDGSNVGIRYQLYIGALATGAAVMGTGLPIHFGMQTAGGAYTVLATSTATTCSTWMPGGTSINIIPLPTVFTVSGGGNYCAGTGGIDVGLSSSETGVNYQLYKGTSTVGLAMAGTGAALDFGTQTAGGAYTIIASNPSTGCSNNMSGNALVVVNPLPSAFTVIGGGSYCAGGPGVHVMLTGSNAGVSYQLMNGPTIVGLPMPGTGAGLDFGAQTGDGTYTVVATNNATSCINTMTGGVVITINLLPNVYTAVETGTNYCAGGSGIDMTLAGSDAGISYQLYNGSTTTGSPISGTGFSIDFGYQTAAGTYKVVAVNTTTGCNKTMSGAPVVMVNPAPTAFNVLGGGNYCDGGAGVHVGLNSSNVGVNYQLWNGVAMGAPVAGTGFALDFGSQTALGIYTVIATNVATSCTNTMSGTATVVINSLPTATSLTGGGNYCAGSGGISVGIAGSTSGINYQLYNGVSPVGGTMAGSGLGLNFGNQTATGTYTVMGINATTGCSNTMSGAVTVGINPLPSQYTVTGGGNFCPGGAGVNVGLAGSTSGISYQLYNGAAPAGASWTGTGSSANFGAMTVPGNYKVIATNPSTSCSSTMSGTATVGLNTLPTVYSVIGGGNFCAGGTGVHVGLNSSNTGISYQLFNGGSAAGSAVTGSGGPIDFGAQAATGAYTVVATNAGTGCTNTMSGTATVGVNPVASPSITLSTSTGDTVCGGHLVTISTLVANGGSTPSFQWSVNGTPQASSGNSLSYLPANGDVVTVNMTSSAACAAPAMVGSSIALTVLDNGMPTATVASTPGSAVCKGTAVEYSVTTAFGGTPSITWIVNGANVSTATTYAYTPANNDEVYVVLNSNYRCRMANTVQSNHVVMNVSDPILPTVSIASNPNNHISHGQSLTLSASVVNGGSTPQYQWFVNGVAITGANMSTYTSSNYNDGDSVTCQVVSSSVCTGLVGFNSVIIHVASGVGVHTVVTGNGDLQVVPNPSKGFFIVKGTLSTTTDEEVSLEVTNMLGQVIHSGKVMTHGGVINERVELNNNIANGMYILNFRSESDKKVFHIVVEQ